ncbi:MAG: zinc-binding alcohol dehydrogenase [Acidobacteriota bacterium]|nr:zinc-binding alcohol dehydrogenase [Acidobacteriota bacterium]
MRQAILYGAGDLRIEDVPLDAGSLQPDQIYVETEVTALSTGTDLGNYSGDTAYVPGAPSYPRGVGYSNVGVIRRVGVHVEKLKPGMRVFSLRPHQSAYIAQQTELLVPVPASLSSEEASLAYLAHLGLASLRQARFEPGENVAIIGLGVIGLCTVWLARAMGAKVVGISNSKIRSESALRLGAHAAFLAEDQDLSAKLGEVFGDVGTDIVVLTANPWNAYRLAMEIARFGGRVSILGFPGRAQEPPDFNPVDPRWVYGKQLTLLGAGFAPKADCRPEDLRFNTPRNLEYILNLMAFHHPRIESVISHRLPASRMKEAYELAREHSKDLVAAVFDWRVPE